MKSLKKKTLVKKASGGPMGEKKPALNKVTPAQSKVTGAKVGESYRTAPIKGDAINAPIRQKLSDYATRGPEPKEYTKYQELTRAASKPAMKRGGSIPKKQDGGSIGKTTESQVFRPNMQPPGGFKPTPVPRKVRKQMERYEDAVSKERINPSPLLKEPSPKIKPSPLKEDKKLYQDLKVTPMKKGGSMSKMTMMKKGGAMKVSTIKKKK
jgi:hypothetical protein